MPDAGGHPAAARPSPCPDCGAPVLLTITAKGRRLHVDPEPNPRGNMACYTDHTGTVRSRGLTRERPHLEHAEWQAMPHPATCKRPRPRIHHREVRHRASRIEDPDHRQRPVR